MNHDNASTRAKSRGQYFPSAIHSMDMGSQAVTIREWGNGDTILLVHSSACDGRQWSRMVEFLAGSNRVVAPDLIGCGLTNPWPEGNGHRLADDARIVMQIIENAVKPVHLVGHSYGGAVALAASVECARHLASLTLIEPSAFCLLASGDEIAKAALAEIECLANDIEDRVARGEMAAAMAEFVDYWWGPGTWQGFDIEKRARLAKCAPSIPADFRRLFEKNFNRAAISQIQLPVLVICGTNSPNPARSLSRIVAGDLPRGRHRTLGHAGHMSPLTHPREVVALIIEHMEHVSASRRRSSVARIAS